MIYSGLCVTPATISLNHMAIVRDKFSYTPGSSHPNGTVKVNANINSKQMTLKVTDNYLYLLIEVYIIILYILIDFNGLTNNKSLFFIFYFGFSPVVHSFNEKGV